jgi:hypothetical protein
MDYETENGWFGPSLEYYAINPSGETRKYSPPEKSEDHVIVKPILVIVEQRTRMRDLEFACQN